MTDLRSRFLYAPFYCEENVWHLSGDPQIEAGQAEVLFISNPFRSCALWEQRAADEDSLPVIWDYHVILVAPSNSGPQVWDLDTRLGFPVDLRMYLKSTFRTLPAGLSRLAPLFRVIDAETYRGVFSSDRSHMRAADGGWLHPPPPWSAIQREGVPGFLGWTEMAAADDDLLNLAQLASLYGIG